MSEERRVERSRCWLITVQAPKGVGNTWRMKTPESWGGKYTYRATCYELGKDAQGIHCHTLINFKNGKSSRVLAKEIIKNNKGSEIDVQVKRGKWSEARNYILKQDETRIIGRIPVEEGELPRDRSKKEEKEERVKNLIDTIKEDGLKGALETFGEEILKHPTGCKLINELTMKASEKRTVLVTIIWGDAGTGKSSWAIQEARKRWGDDVYFYTKVGGSRDTIWFNGYTNQKCIIMDDVSGRTIPYEYIIKITGNDPLDVEIKGGRVPAKWREVIITSNYNPVNWYNRIWGECEETREAFFRRIARIIHVHKEEENVIWEVEKEEAVRVMKDDFVIEPLWANTPRWIREERRMKEEGVLMHDEDVNVANCISYEDENIEKSEIGIIDSGGLTDGTPDTPGPGEYWGGGDSMYLNYGPLKKGRMMAELERRSALDLFVKKVNIVRKWNGGAQLDRGAIIAAIRDKRIKYDEKAWMKALEMREELRRTHDFSEEEWSPDNGYHDLRHDSESEQLYDIIKNWSEEGVEQSFNTQWWEHERIEEIE